MAAGLKVGDVLCGRYPIEGILGEGGMGAVYRASDLRSKRHWAIKEMTDSFDDPEEKAAAMEGFRSEADILCELDHPNLPSITDCFSENGRQYMVMDLVEGSTVEKLLAKSPDKRLSIQQTADIARQLTGVLTFLHSHQPPIIFRDLKPGNIMVTPSGVLKLIDFGIARFFRTGKKSDTRALGTPGYAAPEQYGKGQSDARTDIYAMGATLHQCLTGADPSDVPFKFDPPSRFVPGLPQRLDFVILKSVNIDPAKRWNSAAEFGAAFADACAALRPASAAAPASAGPPAANGRQPAFAPAAPSPAVTAAPAVTPAPAARPAFVPAAAKAAPAVTAAAVTAAPSSPAARYFPSRNVDLGVCKDPDKPSQISVIIHGQAKGSIQANPNWLYCEPSSIDGTDQKIQIFVDPSKIRRKGRQTGFVTFNGEVMNVSIDYQPPGLGCLGTMLSLFLVLSSVLPYWGVIAAVVLIIMAVKTGRSARLFVVICAIFAILAGGASTLFIPNLIMGLFDGENAAPSQSGAVPAAVTETMNGTDSSQSGS